MIIDLHTAIAKLKAGEVVAIPTETVYGLAADARNDAALQQIYAIKQRPANNPLIVHISDISKVEDWAAEFTPLAQRLAQAFWPGPLTLVLPAKAHVSSILRANQPTVALRVPAHPLALQLLNQSDLALAAPSANRFTQLSPTTAEHVQVGLGDKVPVLDGGPCYVGIESTIVAVQGNKWQLLRPGMISAADIQTIAGLPAVRFSQAIKAPGQHALHYSPRTKMQLVPDRNTLLALANNSTAALLIGEGALPNCPHFQLSKHAPDVAQQLYGTLHEMDSMGKELLLVETPPDAPEWAAILDRMTRAAS